MPVGATIAASAVSIGSTLFASGSQNDASDKMIRWAKPFAALGNRGSQALTQFLGLDGNAGPFSKAALAQNPIYNFIKDEGLKGVQNSYAAKGLGTSGAALKGAADYSENAAGQFMTQIYNMLSGATSIGANVVAGTAGNFMQAGNPDAAAGLSIGDTLSSLLGNKDVLGLFGIGGAGGGAAAPSSGGMGGMHMPF